MQDATTAGFSARTDEEASPPLNITDCSADSSGLPSRCTCGRRADGLDARDSTATCVRCASIRPDGGAPFCANCNRTIAREDLVRHRGRTYHAVCAPEDRPEWGAARGAADRSPDRHHMTDGGEATDADIRAAVAETEVDDE